MSRLWSSTSNIPRWNYAVLTLVLGAFSFLMLAESTSKFLATKRASQWPKTDGTVISSTRSAASYRTISWRYHPKVNYSYEVHGSTYEGKFVDYTTRFSDESAASASYRKGQRLSVRYDPQRPSESYVPGVDGATWAGGLTFGMFLLAIAVFTFVRWRECLRESR